MTTKIPAHMVSGASRKNAIINGAFDVWQRGTSFSSVANGAYSADRWRYGLAGTAVHTLSRSTDAPTVAQAGRLFNYSLLVDCTTVDAAIAAGDFTIIGQRIEGYNWLALAQRATNLSFWVKATKTGIYCASLTNDVDRSFVREYTISAADTWEFKNLQFDASPSAGTWNFTSGVGVHAVFAIAAGSTFQTAAGSWASAGPFYATSNQVNGADSTANDFRLAGVQLEVGSSASDFEQRYFQDEIALCQRYYAKTFAYDVAPVQNVGSVTGTLQVSGNIANIDQDHWWFPVTMRSSAPTLTTYNPAANNALWRDTTNAADRAVNSSQLNEHGAQVQLVVVAPACNNHIHAAVSAEL